MTDHKSQKQRILEILQERGLVSNFDLHAMQPPIFQIGTRIFELKQDGEPIIGYHDEKDRRRYWYRYCKPQTDLFGHAAA